MMRRRYIVTTILCAAILVCISLSGRNMTHIWNSIFSSFMNPEFPINEELLCKPEDNVLLLVGVYSGPDQEMERQFIRQNWGAYAKTSPKIRLLFFIGLPIKDTDQDEIQKESKTYHDIIQINSTDTYRNLTLKSFAFFRWSQQFCKNAKYILKIDCDMQIDLKRLMAVIERKNIFDTFQCGVILYNMTPFRTKSHKWYISRETYSKNVWPPYCYGPAYLVSNRIASKIATLRIPKDPFPVDDVFMTGILREMLKENIRMDFLGFHAYHYIKTDTKVVKRNITTYIKPVWVKDIPVPVSRLPKRSH